MKLSDNWFTALSEDERGDIITVYGREDLDAFRTSGKFKERVEITWKYEPDAHGMPSDEVAARMEEMEEALRREMEKDKLAIQTAVYTGGGEKTWVYYTRSARVFGGYLNQALAHLEMLPISLYVEADAGWEEYLDMYEMREWAVDK